MPSSALTRPARRSRSPRAALALSTALLLALAASLLSVAGSNAAGATGPSRCKIVIVGTPWHIRGSGSGHNYRIAAVSGDDHVSSGACLHPPHKIPFFEWTPKR
jgi:hypothetical protein